MNLGSMLFTSAILMSPREERRHDCCPRSAHQRPGDHAANHEQAGNAEIEKSQNADAERQGDGNDCVNGAEHQAVDDLLGENGTPHRC